MACLFAAGLGCLAVCADEVATPTTAAPPPVVVRPQTNLVQATDPGLPAPIELPQSMATGGTYVLGQAVNAPAQPAEPPSPPAPAIASPPPIAPVAPEPKSEPPPVITVEPPAVAPANLTVPAPPPPPLATGVPATPPPPVSPFPWKLRLEVVNGLTQIELRHGDELLMKVQGDKIDLHTPAGGLQATGRVTVSGPCVEARCDRLTIAWATGQVALDGGVRLAFQNKAVIHEMRAESVCFRLNGANQAVDFSAGDVRRVATPDQ
jgi:hypothetical protein